MPQPTILIGSKSLIFKSYSISSTITPLQSDGLAYAWRQRGRRFGNTLRLGDGEQGLSGVFLARTSQTRGDPSSTDFE